MAKKKTSGTRKRPPRKRTALKGNLQRLLLGLSILVLMVAAGGIASVYFFKTEKKPVAKPPALKQPVEKPPIFEIYPKEKPLPAEPAVRPPAPPHDKLPKVAIILDDVGYDQALAKRFLGLDVVLTYSVLPHSPFRKEIAAAAQKEGYEIMLHLPMEPIEYPSVKPGPGALLTAMSPDELIDQLEKNLRSVPFIKGVNNHMGSKMTANSTQLYQIFSILKKRGLFFIDSRTTPKSLCRPSARLLQVPFAERSIFIDHDHEPAAIRRQLARLIAIAVKEGKAVGIAHPHESTYEVLREMISELRKAVHMVPASHLVHSIG